MSQASPAPVRSGRNRWWIVYLLVVLGLTLGATVFLAIFNLSLQLTQEELASRKKTWASAGPRDYDLGYTEKKGDDPVGDQYQVKVRQAKVLEVRENGKLLPEERWAAFGMEKLFERMQAFLDEDGQPGRPKVYTRSRFHEETGGVLEYVRRIMGTRTRLEISVQKYRYGKDVK